MPLVIRVFVLFSVFLAGCGFQLRGAYTLPYENMYISGPDHSPIVASLKRSVRMSGTRLADSAKDAQATLMPAGETRLPIILSLSSAGRVREKRLSFRYGYRVVDNAGRDLIVPGSIEINRDLTYSDSDALSKTQEEELLWQDMQKDVVEQLMRRLSAAKPAQLEKQPD